MRLIYMVFHCKNNYIDHEQNDDDDELVKTTSSKTREVLKLGF